MADTTQNATGGLRPMPKVTVVDDAYSELQVVETIDRDAVLSAPFRTVLFVEPFVEGGHEVGPLPDL
jgi:hypothetical protein